MKKLVPVLMLLSSNALAYTDEQCMALNIYHEARSESMAGQFAVADVVLNRVESNRYPNNVCDVIFQAEWADGKPVLHRCQFSWFCDGKSDTPRELDAWHRAKEVSNFIMIHNDFRGITEGATHYHTEYVNPSWNSVMQLIGSIGDHIFYKEYK